MAGGYCVTDADGHCTSTGETWAALVWLAPGDRIASYSAQVSDRIGGIFPGRHDFAIFDATSEGLVHRCRAGRCRRRLHPWAEFEATPAGDSAQGIEH